MTVDEAINLVISSSSLGVFWKVFILDMWERVNIFEMAQQYNSLAWRDKDDIVLTWLQPWEKMYEELILDEDHDQNTEIEKVFVTQDHGDIADIISRVKQLFAIDDKETLIIEIKKIIPEFKHNF